MSTNIDKLEAEIETFTDASPVAREIAEHLIAKGWIPPKRKGKYQRVSGAANAQVDDLVRSTWGGSGSAVWRVTGRTEGRDYYNRPRATLDLISLSSGRTDSRWSNDLDIVQEAD